MFERLFQRPFALNPHLNGPLVEERRRFLCHRADQGIGRNGLRVLAYYLLACAHSLRLGDRPGEVIPYAEVEEQATLWANRPSRPHDTPQRRSSRGEFLRHACAWLRFLGRLQPPATPRSPFADQIATFADFLLRDKGLSPWTVRGRCDLVRRFLDRLAVKHVSLHDMTLSQIDQALIEQLTDGRYARVTVQGHACDLRSFFSYAESNGWCRVGLAAAIKGPRIYSQESIPAGPSWDDVQKLLAQTDGDRTVDIRDRALLMLLAHYGLRAGEVRRLRLQDFDWQNERLTVTRGKTLSVQTYPLARHVGDAVLRYLKEARPRSIHREVFLTIRPPFRPLGNAAVGSVASRRWRALGISLPHYGSHILRHACATHLLEEGLSLKEIGDHLGHRNPDTTRIYAKVNLAALRQVSEFDLGGLR
jgi:integrase/recombinase XerD